MSQIEKEIKAFNGCLHGSVFPVITMFFGLVLFYLTFAYLHRYFGPINLAIEGFGFWKFPAITFLLGAFFFFAGKPWRYKAAFCIACGFSILPLAVLFSSHLGTNPAARVASCQNNMKQLGLVCSHYAENSKQKAFPMMMCYGHAKFDTKYGNTKSLSDNSVILCPADPIRTIEMIEAIDIPSFSELNCWYLGYAVSNEDEMLAFFEMYKKRMADKKGLSGNIEAESGKGSNGSAFFIQLNNKYTESNDPKLNAKIPLFIEKPENHPFPFINVLFLDGHVEFMHYPGEWPATELMITTLREMENLANKSLEAMVEPS